MINGYMTSQAVCVAAELGLADLLRDGPDDCDNLARHLGARADLLYRLLRTLASIGVFTEVEARRFALTPLADLLRSDAPGSLRALAIMSGQGFFWRPWGRLREAVLAGGVPFEDIYGMPIYTYMDQHPEEAAIFNAGMTGGSAQRAALAQVYDFSGCRTVVDVGGGHGALLAAVLAAHPHLRGILFDLPSVVAGAEGLLRAAGVWDRCEVVGGDFFEGVAGGDTYVLSAIIHNWDDERAVAILRRCHQAMAAGGRVLLIEPVVPPGDTPHASKFLDLVMLVLVGSRERTETEHRSLLASAGFELTRVIPLPAGGWSVVEGARV
jgi:hypothetical protein